MNALSQDSCVSSTEENHNKRESSVGVLEKAVIPLVDSTDIDSVYPDHFLHLQNRKHDQVDTEASHDCKITKSFPWITEFSKLCQAEIGPTNILSLEYLMVEYIRHVSASALECHLKPNRAAKLKKAMNGSLLLFHLFYSDIKKPLEHSSFLDKMSDLMAVYIDMEITASSRSKENPYKIASKLTSSLFIFLDRSHDHILDSIFKTKYMNMNYWPLCNLIFTRVLRESPGHGICDMTYVRYILAFKMWKRVVKGVDEKRNVMKLATMKLHPPPHFRDSVRAGIFTGILPKIPKTRNDITMFLMQAKFCIKETTKLFLKHVCSSEKRGSLSSYLTNFNRIPFSNHIDTDDSRVSSEEDQEENGGSSAALMNNIWSSMSSESEVAHQIRMANIIKGKKQKSKCKKTKCKGIATPVFKSNSHQDKQMSDYVEKLKKKRRLQGMSELPAMKLLSSFMLSDKCGEQSNVTVVRPRMEESSLEVVNVKSCQSPLVPDIKKEPDVEICVDDIDITKQVDRGDSEGGKEEIILAESATDAESMDVFISKQLGVQPTVTAETKDEITTKEADKALETIPSQPVSDKDKENTSSDHSHLNQIPEKIKEKEKCYKSQSKAQKIPPEQDQIKPEPEALKQEKGMLHDQTLRRDYKIFMYQHAFRSSILNNSVSHEMSVPSPYDKDGFEEASKRCTCVQCSANQTALKTNYKILTQYLVSKNCGEIAGNSSLDKNQDLEPSSCLPFKKRKTLPMDKEDEELDGKTTSGTRDNQVSYPNTPMISIAMLDPQAQATRNAHEPSSAIDYSLPSNSEIQSSIIPGTPEYPFVKPELVPKTVQHPGVISSSQLLTPSENKPKFKTPAQLKESPVIKPSDDFPISQTFKNVGSSKKRKSSHSQIKSHAAAVAPISTAALPKTKVKAKVDKNLRKRK